MELVEGEDLAQRIERGAIPLDEAIIAHDLDGTIPLWNSSAERMLGYKAADAIGKPTLMPFLTHKQDEQIETLKRV